MSDDTPAMQFRGQVMVHSGRGFLVPPPLQVSAPSELDARLRREMIGAFEPWVGWAIVNEGMLCFSENGQSLTFVTQDQARYVLRLLGKPKGYEVVEMLAIDRSKGPQLLA